jgi:hypothetical protein
MSPVNFFDRPLICDAIRKRQRSVLSDRRHGRELRAARRRDRLRLAGRFLELPTWLAAVSPQRKWNQADG